MKQRGQKKTFFSLRKRLFLILIVSFFIGIIAYCSNGSKPDFVWSMVNVNHTALQGDAHLIEVNHGKTILIDAGYLGPASEQLVPYLKNRNVDQIDIAFITHPHRDHYEGLIPVLESGITIKTVFFNIPDRSICDREIPWGCNYGQILEYHQFLNQKGVTIQVAVPGMVFDLGNDVQIKILYAFDGINTPVGQTDINDMSLIMMLAHSGRKILFTGDLNRGIGGYLAEATNIQADILKVPHHGVEGVAPNSFFERVSPKYGLVPAPEAIWCSARGSRVRNWFQDNKIPVFVNGVHGHIEVMLYGDEIEFLPETPNAVVCR